MPFYKPFELLAPTTETAAGTSGKSGLDQAQEISVGVDVTAASAATGTPTLSASVEWSFDGTTWFTADPADTFTDITAVGSFVKRFKTKGSLVRVNYDITGDAPSFDFSVTGRLH